MISSWSLQRSLPRFLALLCLASLLHSACGGQVSNSKFFEGSGSLQGTLFLQDGRPAQAALVSVVNLPHLQTKTDASGFFRLDDIPSGRRDIIAHLPETHGKRFEIWIVRREVVTLEKQQGTLLPAGTIMGRVSAQARFGSRGIEVAIKGTEFRTWTRIHQGVFRLDGLPPSDPAVPNCHTLLVSAPFFLPYERKDLCVASGKTTLLDLPVPLEPSTACASTAEGSCPLSAVCNQGFCVPDFGGESHLLQTEVAFGGLPLRTTRTLTVRLLENIGPGPLFLHSVEIVDPSRSFRISEPPDLPLRLKPGEVFSLPILFEAQLSATSEAFGLRQATVRFKTQELDLTMEGRYPAWNPAPPIQEQIRSLRLTAEVVGQTGSPSQCIQVSEISPTLDGLCPCSASPLFSLRFVNLCQEAFHLSHLDALVPLHSGLSKKPLLTAVQTLPFHLPAGRETLLQFQLLPSFYGPLEGRLRLWLHPPSAPAPQEPTFSLPLQTSVQSPLVEITPSEIHFGTLRLGEERQATVTIRTMSPPGNATEVRGEILGSSAFRILSTISSTQGSSHLLQIALSPGFEAPEGEIRAWLVVRGVLGLSDVPFAIHLRATLSPGP